MVKSKFLSSVFLGLLTVGLAVFGASQAQANWHRRGPCGIGYGTSYGYGGFSSFSGYGGYGYRSMAYTTGFYPRFAYGNYYRPLYMPYGYGAPLGYFSSYYSFPSFGYSPLAYGGVWSYGPGMGLSPLFLPNEAKPAPDAEFLPPQAPALKPIDAQPLQAQRPESDFVKTVVTNRPRPLVVASSPLDRGRAALEAGNPGLASRELQRAVAAEPQSIRSRWLLAHSLWLNGKYRDAATQARRVLEDPTLRLESLADAARPLAEMPGWQEGLQRLRQARQAFREDTDLLLLEALALQSGEQAEQAAPLWQQLSANPGDQFLARRILARLP